MSLNNNNGDIIQQLHHLAHEFEQQLQTTNEQDEIIIHNDDDDNNKFIINNPNDNNEPPSNNNNNKKKNTWKDIILIESLQDDLNTSKQFIIDLQQQLSLEKNKRIEAEKSAMDFMLKLQDYQVRIIELENNQQTIKSKLEQEFSTRIHLLEQEYETNLHAIKLEYESRLYEMKSNYQIRLQISKKKQVENRQILEDIRKQTMACHGNLLTLAQDLENKVNELYLKLNQQRAITKQLTTEKYSLESQIQVLQTQLDTYENDRMRDEKLLFALSKNNISKE
jgi:hypothetical protein